MQHLHWGKIIVVFISALCAFDSKAQEHRPNDDQRLWHFGITFAPNFTKSKFTVSENFYSRDSVQQIKSQGFAGLNFGGIADYRLGRFFTLRYLPQIEFSQRNYTFVFKDRTQTAKTETVSLNQCFLLKHHSVRHKNHRFLCDWRFALYPRFSKQ
jgi:hypothetical protein